MPPGKRKCRKCHKTYGIQRFQRKNGTPFGFTCNKCRVTYMMKRYAETREIVTKIKSGPCTDCGQCFPPYCMDFDHRERGKKYKAVSKMSTYKRARLLAEIAKCDLVCAICHRIRTHSD
jgi:hypothetical protein